MVFCADCGSKNDDNAIFCANCGTNLGNKNSGENENQEKVYEAEPIDLSTNPQYQTPMSENYSSNQFQGNFQGDGPKQATTRLKIIIWVLRILGIFGLFALVLPTELSQERLIGLTIISVIHLIISYGLSKFSSTTRKFALGFGILVLIILLLPLLVGAITDPLSIAVYGYMVHTLQYHQPTKILFKN